MAQGNVLSAQHGHNVGCLLCLVYQLQTGLLSSCIPEQSFRLCRTTSHTAQRRGRNRLRSEDPAEHRKTWVRPATQALRKGPCPPTECRCVAASARRVRRSVQVSSGAGPAGAAGAAAKGGVQTTVETLGRSFQSPFRVLFRSRSRKTSAAQAPSLLHLLNTHAARHMPRCRAKEESRRCLPSA